jgi:four helix bundle protein
MNHKDLDVWKKAVDFVTFVYQVTQKFPDNEKFGLTSQLRRAAVSIAANISEGAARSSDKEFIQFLYISLGSSSEVETLLTISNNLKFLDDKNYNLMNQTLTDLKKMILGLIKYLKNKTQK